MKTLNQISLVISLICFSSSMQAQTFTNYTTADGLINDNVICLDVDALGNIWFGTQGGVSKFDGTSWTNYSTAVNPGLVDDNIQAIFVDSNHDLWMGTDFGVTVKSGSSWLTYDSNTGLGNEQIKCINEDQAGNMWFGTNGGLSKFDGVNWTNYGAADGIPFGGVNSITIHSNGDLWIGTGLSGIRVFDGTTFSSITESDGLISDRIRSIAIDDQQGKKWVGTTDGITVLNSSNLFNQNYTTIFTLPPPDTLNPIEDIKIDGNGYVWVGIYVDYLVTEGGISVYNGHYWIEYDVNDGLIGPVVRALDIDLNNHVWVATSTGVSKISDLEYLNIDLEYQQPLYSIFPNPAYNYVSISSEEINGELKSVEIYNLSSQLIQTFQFEVSSSNLTILTEDIPNGIYLIKVGTETRKLIIQH